MSSPDARGIRRILIAEDDRAVLDLLAMVLEAEGYAAVKASSVEEALEVLHRAAVDLVLTDAFSRIPEDALKSTNLLLSAAGSTPVLLCTAHAVVPEEALAAGFRGVIGKPFDIDCLLKQVAHFLSGDV